MVSSKATQASAEAAFVNYTYDNTYFGYKRRDNIYNFSLALIYGVMKGTDIIVQYNRYINQSNIELYDYTRDVYILGMEYRF